MTVSPAGNQPGVSCPECARGTLSDHGDGDFAVCPVCGHRSHPSLVTEAVWLQGQRQQLDARLAWVEARIAAGDTAPTGWIAPVWSHPEAPTAGRLPGTRGSGPVGTTGPTQKTGPTGAPRPSMTAQTLLLGGGALLLVIASIVFAAVAWGQLGAWGQVGLLVVVVGALASAAHGLRHSYRSTAQTLAAVAAAVAAVGFVAAPRLGLGTSWMRDREAAWGALAMLGVVALSAAFNRLSDLRAWRLAAVGATVLAGGAGCLAASGAGSRPAPLAVGALAVLSAGVVLTAGRRGERPVGSGETVGSDLRLVAAGLAGVVVVLSVTAYGDSSRYWSWALSWALVAGSAGAWASRPLVGGSPGTGLRLVAGAAAAHVPVFAAAAVVVGGRGQVHVPVALVAVLGALLLMATALPLVRARHLVPALSVAAGTVWLLGLPMLGTAANDRYPFDATTGPLPELSDRVRVGAGDVEGYVGVVAAALFVVAVVDVLHRQHTWLGQLAWVGACAGTAATWVRLGDTGGAPLEAFTLPSAGLLLAAGAVALVGASREPGPPPGSGPASLRDGFARAGSMVVLGPALAMALLPSAVVTLGEAAAQEPPTRAVATIAAAVVVALAGALLHLRAALFVGLAALVVTAVGQVASVSSLVPRWVAIAVAGALLLGAGFSIEVLARAGRRVWRYAGELD